MTNLFTYCEALRQILFPQRFCLACGEVLRDEELLCADCRKKMACLRSCPCCATFIAATETEYYRCAHCRGVEHPFVLARAALPYDGKLRQFLLDFKYHGRVGLRRPLAALLTETVLRCWPGLDFDVVIPLPLSTSRLAERGYNQSELLSSLVCSKLSLMHRPEWLERTRDTQPLFPLSKSEREIEMRGAFRASKETFGARVLLIDDIFTTGTTASNAARAFLQQGAKEVYVLCVAAGYDQ